MSKATGPNLSRRQVALLKEPKSSFLEGHVWGSAVAHEINLGHILRVAEWDGSNKTRSDLENPPLGSLIKMGGGATMKSLDLVITDASNWEIERSVSIYVPLNKQIDLTKGSRLIIQIATTEVLFAFFRFQ